MEAFHEKAQCIIDQYDLYTVSEVGMSLDGANTQVIIKFNLIKNIFIKKNI